MKTFTLKHNALLELDLNVPRSMCTHGFTLERKSEFHITLINFSTQREIVKAGYSMDDVGSVIQGFLSTVISVQTKHEKAVLLHRTPSEAIPHEEVSIVKLLKKEPWMDQLISKLNARFPDVVIPEIYPHITTHSKNGFGIAVQSGSDIVKYRAGRVHLELEGL